MLKFYKVLVYHCKDNVATCSLSWSKTSKTHRIVSEKPCCNIFCIPVHPKSAIKLLNFIKKTLQYSYRQQIYPYNKKWHIPSILCIIKLLCLQTVSNNYKNKYLKQTKYHKLNVVTALIRQNTFVLYKRETRIVTNTTIKIYGRM